MPKSHRTTSSRVGNLVILLLALVWMRDAFPDERVSAYRKSLFKIRVTSTWPDYRQPWQLKSQRHSSGSGFYLGNQRIMTNAHVVSHAHFITVQADGDGRAIPAEVEFIAHDCDLAILRTSDPRHWPAVRPVAFGAMPRLHSPVATVGFPTGGEQISITKGVVSRIDYRRYAHPLEAEHLLLQVDAAINPGNSGGPVFQDGKVIGVAFQSHRLAENTGYVIPTPVIQRFLRDIRDGTYDGHPEDGIEIQSWATSNPATASFHGLKPDEQGVKVSAVAHWSPGQGVLEPGDVLLSIDGKPIDADGKISMFYERIQFKAHFDLKDIGDRSVFKIVRDRLRKTVTIPSVARKDRHYAGYVYRRHPRYLVVGGLVFAQLTRSYLRTWGPSWYKRVPTILRYLLSDSQFDNTFRQQQEFIVLIGRLAHQINFGTSISLNTVVDRVNGTQVQSLKHMANVLDSKQSEFLRIDFLGEHAPIILPTATLKGADEEIAKQYSVQPYQYLKTIDGAVAKIR